MECKDAKCFDIVSCKCRRKKLICCEQSIVRFSTQLTILITKFLKRVLPIVLLREIDDYNSYEHIEHYVHTDWRVRVIGHHFLVPVNKRSNLSVTICKEKTKIIYYVDDNAIFLDYSFVHLISQTSKSDLYINKEFEYDPCYNFKSTICSNNSNHSNHKMMRSTTILMGRTRKNNNKLKVFLKDKGIRLKTVIPKIKSEYLLVQTIYSITNYETDTYPNDWLDDDCDSSDEDELDDLNGITCCIAFEKSTLLILADCLMKLQQCTS